MDGHGQQAGGGAERKEQALGLSRAARDCHARRVSAQGRGGGARTRGSNAHARLRQQSSRVVCRIITDLSPNPSISRSFRMKTSRSRLLTQGQKRQSASSARRRAGGASAKLETVRDLRVIPIARARL